MRRPPPPVPLVAVAAVGYIAGCFIGFLGSPVAPALAIALAAGAALATRRAREAGLALGVGAGIVVAAAAARDDRACLRAIRRAPELQPAQWTAVLEGAAAPGAYVPARLVRGRCRLRGALIVVRGAAAGGASVALAGTATVRDGRVVVMRATMRPLRDPGVLARWRARSARAVDRVFPRDAPLAHALLLADMRSIDPAVKDRFAASGLVHALSVSGLHVGIIGAAAELAFGVVLGARAASGATIVLVTLYVAMVGAPPPAVRAAAMLGAVAASRALDRPTTPWAVVAIGAVLTLGDPRTVLDLGWQLSVLGVASLIVAARVNERLTASLPAWLKPIAGAALTSAIASIASAPLVAYAIGRVSLIGPVANIFAGPLFNVVQPMLFLGLALAPFGGVAEVVGDAVHVPLLVLDWVARTTAAVPHASVTIAPTLAMAVVAGIATAATFVAGAVRNPRPPIAIAAASATLLCTGLPTPPRSATEVHVLDVGQGDAIAIRTRRDRWVLVDAGRNWKGNDAARTVVLPWLRRHGGTVAALVITHPHSDHIGGARSIVESSRPAALYDPAYVAPSGTYRELLGATARTGVPWRRPAPGDSLVVDEAVIRFLAPDPSWVRTLHDANDASIVVQVVVGKRRILLTGDAEHGEEEWLVARYGRALRADVLKVGHHGSNTSSTPAFLEMVQPAAALISVGAGNDYGHPATETLEALGARGAHIVRTDHAGTIVVRTDGESLEIEADRFTWRLPRSSRP